jgi:hypothetical protein
MKPIGGYFELELPLRSEYHGEAIALNTGRNCLEYILRVRGYKRVFLPYYSCEVLLEPFNKLGIDYTFYHINERLEIDEDITLGDGEALLCINYFGLKQDHVETLAAKYGQQLIVDNTQAFYARPIEGIDTFYSCRKFFGVPDGAYLYCDKPLDMELEQDQSWDRMDYLLKRIDVSPEAAYPDFKARSADLRNNPIKTMSPLTHRIMASIDYQQVAQRRRDNYGLLDEALNDKNRISLPLANDTVPMVYPFLTNVEDLRKRLINNQIFVAQYWPNVLDWCEEDCREYQLTKQLLPLPIDQRYGEDDMKRINELR